MNNHNVNRKDVAQKAGVSVSVVSRALNNSGYVAKEKKERVLKVARELGYHPNPVAMSLQSRRTKQILFFLKDITNIFNIELYQGMVEAARKHGYMMVLNGSLDFSSIKNTMVDGIIMPHENVVQNYLDAGGKNYFLPVVTASYSDPIDFPHFVPRINIDMYKAVELAVDYLKQLGHQKIAYATPYPLHLRQIRMIAFQQAMGLTMGSRVREYLFTLEHQRSLEEHDAKDFDAEDFFAEGGAVAKQWLEKKSDATAVLCFNDLFAAGFCAQLMQNGIRIPADLSVMGIDGSMIRSYMQLELTTVQVFPRMQGKKTVDVLVDMIEGRRVRQIYHMPIRVLKGKTVRKIR